MQTWRKFQFFIHCLRKFQYYKTYSVHDSEVSDMLSFSTLLRMWHVTERQWHITKQMCDMTATQMMGIRVTPGP